MTGILVAAGAGIASNAGDFIGISDATINDTVVAGTASGTYQLTSGGKYNYIRAHASTITGDWVIPNGNAGNYEALVTVTSGTLTSGTAGSWVSLGTTQSWVKTVTNAAASVTFTLSLRIAATGVVVKTITVTIDVDGSP